MEKILESVTVSTAAELETTLYRFRNYGLLDGMILTNVDKVELIAETLSDSSVVYNIRIR